MESKVRGDEEDDGERQKVERLVEKLNNINRNNKRPSTRAHVSFVPNLSSKFSPSIVSSRKLAAAFWEFHHYYEDRSFSSSAGKMHRGGNGFAGASNRRQRHGKAVAVKENGLDLSQFLRDPSPDHQVSILGFLRQFIGLVLDSLAQKLRICL